MKSTTKKLIREAFKRGYKAAKRRLNESARKGIWEIVEDDLEHHFKNYRRDLSRMVDDMLDDGFILGGHTGQFFYKEVHDWYDSLGNEDGNWGMEDDLLSQVGGAIDAWIRSHQKEILDSDPSFNRGILQELSSSLFRQYIGEIGYITNDRAILSEVGLENLIDDDY